MPGGKRRSIALNPREVGETLKAWMQTPEFYRERVWSPVTRLESILEPAALMLLIGCLAIGITELAQAFVPGWDARFVIPFAVIAALAAYLYGKRLARPSAFIREWLTLLVPLLLLLKLVEYRDDVSRLLVEVPLWWSDPGQFFDFGFVVGGILIVTAWVFALGLTHNLNGLRLQPGELPARTVRPTDIDAYDPSWHFVDHGEHLSSLAGKVLWGGVMLVMVAGLVAADTMQVLSLSTLYQLFGPERPAPTLALSNVIAYYAAGLLLLAHAQLTRQRTSWQVDQLVSPSAVASRWGLQAMLAVAVIVGIAILLPTDYVAAMALLVTTLFQIISFLSAGLLILSYLVFAILSWPLRFLISNIQGEPSAPPPIQLQSDLIPGNYPLLEIIRSLLFFAAMVGLTYYAGRALWRNRPVIHIPASGPLARVWAFLLAMYRMLLSAGKHAIAILSVAPGAVSGLLGLGAISRRAHLRLLGLGSRELVIYFYLSVVERARSIGQPRRAGETALEFSRRLPESLPDAEPDLGELTAAFVEARYSARGVDNSALAKARERWQRLRARLRARRPATAPAPAKRRPWWHL